MSAELQAKVDAMAPWYHDIDLGDGVRTVGWQGIKHVWDHVRRVRAAIESKYVGATVLDLASWDGMWAFEAEKLGANPVLAFELGIEKRLPHFLLCREQLRSSVLPMYGADAERIHDFTGQFTAEFGMFDIVQHFGLLYHLKNPMRSLESCRRVMKKGGVLMLETAGMQDADGRALMLSNADSKIYTDAWTYWAPSVPCLRYMLAESGFSIREESVSVMPDDVPRICLIAEAI